MATERIGRGKSESIFFRLTKDEKRRLQHYADERELTLGEVLRDFCKKLPTPKPPKKESTSN